MTWRNCLPCSFLSSSGSSSRSSTVRPVRLRWLAASVIVTGFAVLSIGCAKPPAVVPSGEPMLIVEGCGKVRLTAMKPDGTWSDLGWRDASSLHGYTVVAYDWQLEPKP